MDIKETKDKVIKEMQNKLREELMTKRKGVFSDTLNFSVGEITNLYRDEEIDLEPAFQRLFRWDTDQQTKFIESLLLGYPVPAIFVYQKEDGIWEVIDGVQRISTLLSFQGLLSEQPLILDGAEILEELNGKCWDEKTYSKLMEAKELDTSIEKEEISYIDRATSIDLKRSRIPVILLDNRSEMLSKFELFKRLNSGGSHLNDQELRNALILMKSECVYKNIKKLASNVKFKEIINLDDNGEKLRFDMEIITRYLILANSDILSKPLTKEKLEHFIDRNIENIIITNGELIETQLNNFETIIEFLYDYVDSSYSFKKIDLNTGKLTGQFSWFVFETIIYGLLKNFENLKDHKESLADKIKKIEWPTIQGKRSPDRMLRISKELGEKEINID